ncbi:aromatic ring-hydroxylating oxygenase subunit alpha [Shewanella morhuae]|uniref:Anthranilate 1,2-dioxygenase large subunit n=1 Tax=Shewanella morhuae TaxID=365591 RepID=A0A380A7T3_9GAMM|nr:aromatic ring-hydroxylating dioxygenase subunit alpha [Shewanella morhuae]SUI75980.1 Anthranilate 1,2-dioxygenase large subunit [Shewanella morhuae]
MISTQSILPKHYYDLLTFEQELSRVFEQNWIFVGFKEHLSKNNDFITITIGNTPVVVQNFNGQISALLNICSHRKATLQRDVRGNRPLRCPYHCWSYKSDGVLAGVPQNRTDFGLDETAKKHLALKQFTVDICGELIFVRVAARGPSLIEFLGPYFSILQRVSTDFTEQVQEGSFLWNTNWKIACETVLEVYHVAGVHPETFANFAKAECEIENFNGHTTGNTPLQDATHKWWAGARKHLKTNQHSDFKEYNHFFIYPNLAIGLTNGSLMSLQTYDPIDPTHTKLNYQLKMISKPNDRVISEAVKTAINLNFTQFNHTILEEDRVIAESCQKNMPHCNVPGLLGKCEDRIRHFHNAWRLDLNELLEGL